MFRIICILFLLSQLDLVANHLKLNLQKALQQKLVKASAMSLGSYQDYCMNFNIQNLGKDSLIILVEAGRRLNSINEQEQDILIVKEELIALSNHQTKTLKLKGYCCQSSHRAPSLNAKYDLNKLGDSDLVSVARYLNKNCFNIDIEQHAIWAISDKKLTANISSQSDTNSLSLRQLVANLKGEKLPWYMIKNQSYISRNGEIHIIPTYLIANLKYNNDTEGYAMLSILDEKGNKTCLTKGEWLKLGSNINYAVNLPIKNLEKGKYKLIFQTRDREILTEDFEI